MKEVKMNPIICPLLNGLHLTLAAHKTFLAQSIPITTLYINNSSTDGTTEWLNSLGRVTIFYNVLPRGVASSWNQGLDFAFKSGAEHALVVNNDVMLHPNTYEWLLESGYDFVTPVGNNDPESIRSIMKPDFNKTRKHPDYSCFLIKKSVWEKVGRFDEGYEGAYCEDADYHLRLHRAGIDAVCLDFPFYHLGAGTIKTSDKLIAAEIIRIADRNRSRFRQKYGVEVGSPEYYQLFGGTSES